MKDHEKNLSKEEIRNQTFKRHFGKLSLEAAIMSVEAYFDEQPDKSIVLAWLRGDNKAIKHILTDMSKEERGLRTRTAMNRATHHLFNHSRMQKHRKLLPK
jgi:hypothetical protein